MGWKGKTREAGETNREKGILEVNERGSGREGKIQQERGREEECKREGKKERKGKERE